MAASLNQRARDTVQEYLRAALLQAAIETLVTRENQLPLLLVRTNYNFAGFGFANGNWRDDYSPLYEDFKTHCGKLGRQLDDLDVNFVYCVPEPGDAFDRFSSEVETDVYFCRKFVVPLLGKIEVALARLPFLPLEKVHGGSLRPDPAQRFLQRHGVSSALAKNLVLPHQRGEEEIVNDCLNGSVGLPELTEGKAVPTPAAAERPDDGLWIESVEIENFRAYRERQRFDMASKVTVLYGPNGFGKTSFFDAVDFAITGQIGRLFRLSDAQIAKVSPHLDSDPENSVVNLNLRYGPTVRRISRTVADPNWATLDGARRDRKHILAAVTTMKPPGSERVDHLTKLFRATHLFNQEGQELTRRVQEDSRLPASLVSRMLAFEDYANALIKTQKVVAHLKKQASEYREAANAAAEIARTERAAMSQLTQQAQLGNQPATLDDAIATLREKLLALGIEANETPVDMSVIRGWRGRIEGRHAESGSRIAQLDELSLALARQPESASALASARTQLAQKQLAMAEADQQRVNFERLHAEAERALATSKQKLKELSSRSHQLEWIKGNQLLYGQLVIQERRVDEELTKLAADGPRLADIANQTSGEVNKAESQAAGTIAKLDKTRSLLRRLEEIASAHPTFLGTQKRHTELTKLREDQERLVAEARPAVATVQSSLRPLQSEEEQLSRQISEADQGQSELHNLLTALEGHIHSGVCPVCAADYAEKGKLIERMRAHSELVTAPAARARLLVVRSEISTAREVLNAAEAKVKVLEQQLAATQRERESLEKSLGQFEQLTAGTGLFPGFPEGEFRDELARLTTKARQQLTAEETESKAAHEALAKAREQASTHQQAAKLLRGQTAEKQKLLADAKAQLAHLRSDERLGNLSFDVAPEDLLTIERTLSTDLTAANEALAKQEPAEANTKGALTAARQKLSAFRSETHALQAQIGAQETAASRLKSQIAALSLPESLAPTQLTEMIREETQRHSELGILRDTASSVDVALDAATTAAAVARLADKVHAAEKAKTDADAALARLAPWASFFDRIESLLSGQQETAITAFTQAYGPRASVIQRRLRPVYGFDDITLTPDSDGIVVGAIRRGVSLRPPDFFSQSQQQTLILALFLTACSSQTWSSFSPVLLDDPVSHFDDLNTYAFLDLLIGFIESPSMKRQFIISTCDDRLFQLARQKFRHLGEDAKFYTFAASGVDGPRVERV